MAFEADGFKLSALHLENCVIRSAEFTRACARPIFMHVGLANKGLLGWTK